MRILQEVHRTAIGKFLYFRMVSLSRRKSIAGLKNVEKFQKNEALIRIPGLAFLIKILKLYKNVVELFGREIFKSVYRCFSGT